MSALSSPYELEVSPPLRDCLLDSEVICVRECCGIDAISEEPELVAAWGRRVGHQKVVQALRQVEELIAQVEDRSHDVISLFLNACTDGEVGREKLLSFLRCFEAALRSRPVNEVLTRAEMEARFDGEWVLIANPEMDENREVAKGLVVSHSPDRQVVDSQETDPRIRHLASLYFGPPTEMRICLNGPF